MVGNLASYETLADPPKPSDPITHDLELKGWKILLDITLKIVRRLDKYICLDFDGG